MFQLECVGLLGTFRAKVHFKKTPLFVNKFELANVVRGGPLFDLLEFKVLAMNQVPGLAL